MGTMILDRQIAGRKSTSAATIASLWADDPYYEAAAGFAAADRSPPVLTRRGARDLTEFSTPQRVTVMGRQQELVEFRTPQHPLQGTNNWGGDSPLLSRNIPKESLLETSYVKFNPDDESVGPRAHVLPSPSVFDGTEGGGGGGRRRGGWLFSKFGRRKREERVLGGGSDHRRKWSGWLDYRTKWPQGW